MLRRVPRRVEESDLNLTSMMDLFTIILTFLLHSLAATDVSIAPSPDLELPFSSADTPVELAVNVIVTRGELVVDGEGVLALESVPDPASPGALRYSVPASAREDGSIAPLLSVLRGKAERARQLAQTSGREDHAFKGHLLLQCDRELPYALVRDIMLTASRAGFGEFQFVVYRRE